MRKRNRKQEQTILCCYQLNVTNAKSKKAREFAESQLKSYEAKLAFRDREEARKPNPGDRFAEALEQA